VSGDVRIDWRPLPFGHSLLKPSVHGRIIDGVIAASLRDPQVDLADAGVQRLRLKTVGVALTIGSQARLGQEHTGDLQKQCCTNLHAGWPSSRLRAARSSLDPTSRVSYFPRPARYLENRP
jgi:hypothetical protein